MQEEQKSSEEILKEQLDAMEKKNILETAKLINALKERFGPEVLEIADRLTSERAFREGQEFAASLGSNSIEDIIKNLWESGIPQGLEYTSRKMENGMQMRCTRCIIHEKVKELGVTETAYHMFCAGDPSFVEGFNPKMGFRRTKSLMQGDDHCDHYFYMKDDK